MILGIAPAAAVVAPIAIKFVTSVMSLMVRSRIGSAAAAEMAAADFEYFQQLSDAEITSIALEMAKAFPEYPYWEWFEIMSNLRKYGMWNPPEELEPDDVAPQKKAGIGGTGLIMLGLVAVVFLMMGKR